jgi:hypothetical protein
MAGGNGKGRWALARWLIFEALSRRAYCGLFGGAIGSCSGKDLHREMGNQDGAAPRSLTENVIEPLRVRVFNPIKLMFPPLPKVTGPLTVKKVAISPGPRLDWIVVIGVAELVSPTVCAPPILIKDVEANCAVIPLVPGRLVLPKNSLS